jgi:hypothetical protein
MEEQDGESAAGLHDVDEMSAHAVNGPFERNLAREPGRERRHRKRRLACGPLGRSGSATAHEAAWPPALADATAGPACAGVAGLPAIGPCRYFPIVFRKISEEPPAIS